jgi:hypothetical protein
MEGFSLVTPVTVLNRPNTGKEDDDDVFMLSLSKRQIQTECCDVNASKEAHVVILSGCFRVWVIHKKSMKNVL